MRWWMLLCGCLLLACGNGPSETATPASARRTAVVDTFSPPADTFASTTTDTAAHASFAVTRPKAPSGIYEFILDYDKDTKILHTISFSRNNYRLQEEYLNKPDSVVVTEGTWAPSQGYIWLYDRHVVRGRYQWKEDTLQYHSVRLKKNFSMQALQPATANPAWQAKEKDGAVLYAIGTEPFWSVEVKGEDSIIVSMPDGNPPARLRLGAVEMADKNMVYSATADSLRVQVSPLFCSDGMSDFTYSHRITMQYKGQTYKGCGVVFGNNR